MRESKKWKIEVDDTPFRKGLIKKILGNAPEDNAEKERYVRGLEAQVAEDGTLLLEEGEATATLTREEVTSLFGTLKEGLEIARNEVVVTNVPSTEDYVPTKPIHSPRNVNGPISSVALMKLEVFTREGLTPKYLSSIIDALRKRDFLELAKISPSLANLMSIDTDIENLILVLEAKKIELEKAKIKTKGHESGKDKKNKGIDRRTGAERQNELIRRHMQGPNHEWVIGLM